MSRLFYHTMQDNLGNLLFNVSGTMRLAGTGTLATIYGDEALTIPIGNPMTNHVSYGSFKCYLGPGSYDFYMAKSGYTFETLTGLQGLGTLANQNSNAVVISSLTLNGTGAIDTAPEAATAWSITHNKTIRRGIRLTALTADTGFEEILFQNVAGSTVGYIATTGTTTSYVTSSDARLKHAVDDLTGELAVIQALRPVRFVWNADGEPGVGFLASEVAAVVAGIISGEPDAMNEDGSIRPQGIDYGKLVPFLVGALKTLAAQVTALTARVAVLEDAAGV